MFGAVGRDESFDSLARHDMTTTTLQRAVMSPVQMPRLQQQQLTQRQAPDTSVTRCVVIVVVVVV